MYIFRFYWVLAPIVALLLPINAPVEYWGESILNSFMLVGLQRISLSFHGSYLVNSAQCIWRLTPGDRYVKNFQTAKCLNCLAWKSYCSRMQ